MRIDLAGWTRAAALGPHEDFLALFEAADRLGFDGVWFNEFRLHDPPQLYPSTLLLAAALFARTERLRVGTSVLVLPLHQPALLAEEIAQLDWQSGGRLDIGLGRGASPATFALLGVDPETTRERFEAGYRILLSAWSGPVSTVQRPHPPLYIAGYTRETLAFAVAEDLPLLLSLDPDESRQLAIYDDLLTEQGGPSAPARSSLERSSLSRYVIVAPTAQAAQAEVERLVAGRLGRGNETLPALVHGDPDACIRQILKLKETLGVGALRCVFNGNGIFDNATALRMMELFAAEVLPSLR